MPLGDRQKQKVREAVDEHVRAVLEPGEEIEATALGMSMPRAGWTLLINAGLIALFRTRYLLVVTDRRLLGFTVPKLKPDRAELAFTSYPKSQVQVSKFKRRWTGARLHLDRLNEQRLRVQCDRAWRDEAAAVNAALSAPSV